MFESAVLKTERAEKHIGELNVILEFFVNANKAQIINNFQPGEPFQYISFEALNPPEEIALIIGDVCHNLRSALDHIAAEIADLGGGDIMVSKFPASETPEGFKKAVDKHIDPFSNEVANALLCKAYDDPAWHQVIYGVGALNNADKHRRLILAFTRTALVARGIQIGSLRIGKIVAEDTSMPIVVRGGTPVQFDKEFEPSISLVFGKGEIFDAKSVIPTLGKAAKAIQDTIKLCAQHYVI